MDKKTVDSVKVASSKNLNEFKTLVNKLILNKVRNRIDTKRAEIRKSF